MYIVVYGLKNAGLTDELHELILYVNQNFNEHFSIVSVGFISGILSAFLNNLPSIMIMNISLEHINSPLLVYANIIGANIGPKLTPFGSLATLLWLDIMNKKGVHIDYKIYMKYTLIVTPIVLFFTLLVLSFSK